MSFPSCGYSLTVAFAISWLMLGTESTIGQSVNSTAVVEAENKNLRFNLEKTLIENSKLHEIVSKMRTTLAASNGENVIIQHQLKQMKLRMEAFGINTVSGGNAKLEQRLLAAVKEIRSLSLENRHLSESLVSLVEAAAIYSKTTTGADPNSRLNIEAELRLANNALGGSTSHSEDSATSSASVSTVEGAVVGIKQDLALVVMNLGSDQGVKVGMPFQIVRNLTPIGTARVVDVREKISGAIIQNLNSESTFIKLGDVLKVDARLAQNFIN